MLQACETQIETGDSVDIQCVWRYWWFSEHSVCVKLVTANSCSELCQRTFTVGTKLAMHVRDCDIWRHHYSGGHDYSRGHSPNAWNWDTHLWLKPDGTAISLDNMQFTVCLNGFIVTLDIRWQHPYQRTSTWQWLMIPDGNIISVDIHWLRGSSVSFSVDIHWQRLVLADGDVIPVDHHFVHTV